MPVQGKQIFRRAARAAHGHILLLETYVSSSGRRQKTPGFSGEADRTYGDRTKHVKKARQRYPASVSQAPGRPSLRTAAACKSTRNEADRPFFSTFCRLSGMIILMVPCRRPRRIAPAQDPAGTATSSNAGSSESGKGNASSALPYRSCTGRCRVRHEHAAHPRTTRKLPGNRPEQRFHRNFSEKQPLHPHRAISSDNGHNNMLRHHPGRRIP